MSISRLIHLSYVYRKEFMLGCTFLRLVVLAGLDELGLVVVEVVEYVLEGAYVVLEPFRCEA